MESKDIIFKFDDISITFNKKNNELYFEGILMDLEPDQLFRTEEDQYIYNERIRKGFDPNFVDFGLIIYRELGGIDGDLDIDLQISGKTNMTTIREILYLNLFKSIVYERILYELYKNDIIFESNDIFIFSKDHIERSSTNVKVNIFKDPEILIKELMNKIKIL